MPHKETERPSAEEFLACQAMQYEWATSFDTKDWDRLSACLAPKLYIDYRAVIGKMWEDMPSADFVALASNPHFLGNARIKTQHLIGAGKWSRASSDEIVADSQMRVAHQKYADDKLEQVDIVGHAHGRATFRFRRVDGEWKFYGLTAVIEWTQNDYAKIFGPP